MVSLFQELNAPREFDYLSVDIDSCDVFVFWAMLGHYRPRVVSSEWNTVWPMEEAKSMRCDADKAAVWKGDDIVGASLKSLGLAAQDRGYIPIFADPLGDVFFIRKDLVYGSQGYNMFLG